MTGKESGGFCCKIYSHSGETLVAMCDAELVGKKFSEKDLRLFVDEKFYREKACDEGGVKELFREATMLNLVGKRIIEIAIAEGFVNKDSIITIDSVPHAQYAALK
ncbi:MAG: DUF424 family protein [Candidatus Aenigmatarchaeota archaeon]